MSIEKFEPNKILLSTVGWKKNSTGRGPVKYYYKINTYDYYSLEREGGKWILKIFKNLIKTTLCKINSNIELRKAIIKYEIYTDFFKREMRLNKLLK